MLLLASSSAPSPRELKKMKATMMELICVSFLAVRRSKHPDLTLRTQRPLRATDRGTYNPKIQQPIIWQKHVSGFPSSPTPLFSKTNVDDHP